MTTFTEAEPAADQITLAAAAEQLDVHYMTAYRYVRTGRMVAEKRAGKWWVTTEDLARVVAEGTGARRRDPQSDIAPRENLLEPFTARLIAGDTAGCWDLLSAALTGGATPVELHTKLLSPSLRDIGEAWHRGELTIADEHRATAAAYRLLGQMGPLFRHRGRRRGSIILGTVAGDTHAMPTAIMADLLSDLRFDVIDLGANTPAGSFVAAAEAVDDLVGIGMSVILDECVERAIGQLGEIKARQPDSFLLVGGPAVGRSGRMNEFAAHADHVSASADDVCQAFEAAATHG